VGHEGAVSLPRALAGAFPRHYNGFHYRYTPKAHVDAMLQHALSTLAAKEAEEVPLLPLPKERGELALLRPLLKSRVLPLYPLALRGEHSEPGDPEAEFAILRQS
jgi:hypothetical protein